MSKWKRLEKIARKLTNVIKKAQGNTGSEQAKGDVVPESFVRELDRQSPGYGSVFRALPPQEQLRIYDGHVGRNINNKGETDFNDAIFDIAATAKKHGVNVRDIVNMHRKLRQEQQKTNLQQLEETERKRLGLPPKNQPPTAQTPPAQQKPENYPRPEYPNPYPPQAPSPFLPPPPPPPQSNQAPPSNIPQPYRPTPQPSRPTRPEQSPDIYKRLIPRGLTPLSGS